MTQLGIKLSKARKLHGRCKFLGLDISIENRKGSYRYWYDSATQRQGRTKMLFPYGYIRRTEGTDGDHLDVYLGPNETADYVYVVDQGKKGNWGEFDEQKVMLGFDSFPQARDAYLAHYNDIRFLQRIHTLTVSEFLHLLGKPQTKGTRIVAKSLLHRIGKSPIIVPTRLGFAG